MLGKERVFYIYGGTPADMGCVNLVHSGAEEWKAWREKGIVAGRAQTWFKILRNPVEKGAEVITGMDYGGNPKPVIIIDGR